MALTSKKRLEAELAVSTKGLLEAFLDLGRIFVRSVPYIKFFALNVLIIKIFCLIRTFIPKIIEHTFKDYVILADQLIFFGYLPNTTLQNHFNHLFIINFCTHVWISYFFVLILGPPLAYLLRLKWRWQYLVAQSLTLMFGLAIYAAVPTEPPWMAIKEVTRLTASELTGKDTNATAAMPSIHFAATFLLFCMANSDRHTALRVILGSYTAAMGFSLVYLGEHYVADLLAGLIVAWISWSLAVRYFNNRTSGQTSRSPTVTDSVGPD